MTGFPLDEPPNFQNEEQVKMRACLCFLDQFEVNYSEQQFITLFHQVNQGDQKATAEFTRFVTRNVGKRL